jgi:flagellar assembly protein FliH
MRAVSWAAAPLEAAAAAMPLPMQTLSAPLPHRPAFQEAPMPSLTPPAPGFELLASASAPPPSAGSTLAAPAPPPSGPSPQLEAAVKELRQQGERLAQQARSDALELGMLVAKKILERELTTNHEALFALIKSAIRRVGDAHTTTVRLCPADAQHLETQSESVLTLGEVKIVADESLGPGDVMVDTEHHTVDGRLATRLEEVARALDGEAD